MKAMISTFGPAHLSPCARQRRLISSRFRSPLVAQAVAVKVPPSVNEVTPMSNLVYVRVAKAEDRTLGGVLLPGSSQARPTSGQVVSVGDGRLPGGKTMEFTVKPGDEVIYSKFGFAFTELEFKGDEYLLIREHDIIGIMPRPNAIADDIPELQPIGDRVLVKVEKTAGVSAGGVVLPDSALERPLSGVVIRTGAGKLEDDGTRTPPSVKDGDKIVYFKYAGDNMETTDGTLYVVLHENDILCKA